jgi:hypothetical protein
LHQQLTYQLGLANKIYVTNDDNKRYYTWNGTIYQPLATIQDVENAKILMENLTIQGHPLWRFRREHLLIKSKQLYAK